MIYLVAALTILVLFFGFFCIRFALIILRMQESIEESLDLIDEKYQRISEIHDIPVFYDSPEIRRLIAEIESTKYVILDIANKLALKAERQSKSEDEV